MATAPASGCSVAVPPSCPSSTSSGSEEADGGMDGGWSWRLRIFGLLALHWLLSSTLTFSNNFLVDRHGPNLSVLVAACQCASAFCLLLPLATRRVPSECGIREQALRSRTFLPLCCSYVGMQTFNRLSLRQVGVACLQISRSLTVVFTVCLTIALLRQAVRRTSLCCCVAVIAGFSLGVNQSLDTITVKGFVFGTISSLFTSFETTLTKKTLPNFANSPLLLTCAMNGVAACAFVPILLLTGQLAVLADSWHAVGNPNFLALLALSCVITATFGVFTYKVIQLTSPLTLIVSNSAHTVSQTVVAVLYFGQPTTALWWLSIILILMGTSGYALDKSRDTHHSHLHEQAQYEEKSQKKKGAVMTL